MVYVASMEKGGSQALSGANVDLFTKRQYVKGGTIWEEGDWFCFRHSEMEIPVERASGNAW